MDARCFVIYFGYLTLPYVLSQEPINKMFTVGAEGPTPDLACLVGFHSIDADFNFRVNCSEAHEIEIPISFDRRKELKWEKKKKTLRFGTQEDNTPWPQPVNSWVCSTTPQAGTVTFNCVPENQASDWFKAVLRGPAYGPYGRKPGCNGAVCYCNDRDFCNSALQLHSVHTVHTVLSVLSLFTLHYTLQYTLI
ncbi:uncharacterized protein LOC111716106 isoform X1 [Eurytemora carolleeae]|uniref:uncharacterized protein LOC111716106 isoform X1 n=1 Tax=Eurytemora carolleeae TaxID=1294199 RepID=UPI000C7905BB|nr:uncharacterized protein LOC111716106 isoform X1 [Eurytemora carolleeae]|eukprot:XP_023347291.1 uncharacterized protein LOC111716106 isoform X1 [Eurytemora affinis]